VALLKTSLVYILVVFSACLLAICVTYRVTTARLVAINTDLIRIMQLPHLPHDVEIDLVAKGNGLYLIVVDKIYPHPVRLICPNHERQL